MNTDDNFLHNVEKHRKFITFNDTHNSTVDICFVYYIAKMQDDQIYFCFLDNKTDTLCFYDKTDRDAAYNLIIKHLNDIYG